MEKTAKNMKIIAIASKIAKAIEDESEDILKDTEDIVRKYIPARYVKAALNKIEKYLDDNGVEAEFDKTVSKDAFKKTASLNYTAKELHEAIDTFAKAAKEEFEDTLKDGEEVANRVIARFAKSDRPEVESKLKGIIEHRLHKIGVYCKLARVTYDPKARTKKAVAAIMNAKKEALAKADRRERIKERIAKIKARRRARR